ncbi:MAG: hypothetical protein QOJ01_141 [Solirubrobacterales bacterium]|nr:hypothetical protein [Solirubrobacterales bacterium]
MQSDQGELRRVDREKEDGLFLDERLEDDPFAELDREPRRRPRPRQRRQRRRGRGEARALLRTDAGRLLVGAVTLLFAATLIGLIALWPPQPHPSTPSQAFGGATLAATVDSASIVPCPGPVASDCRRIQVTPTEGPEAGKRESIDLGPVLSTPNVSAGAHVRVLRVAALPGSTASAQVTYQFVDFDRRSSLLWLAVAFAALVLVLARWRGLLALVGFAASLLIVIRFLIPGILAGTSPLEVSLIGALAAMFTTLVLTSGFGVQTLAAALGIGASLLFATLLGDLWAHIAHLNGLTSELAIVLPQSGIHVSLQGIVIAGMVIGALGVLADMAVTQASAVMALRKANPDLSARALYRGAFAVGRDHLAATINTLVLAYVGAALPLLLILQGTGVGLADALNTQDVAEPIIATLVGSIGLIAAVPLTTGLAALLARRLPPAALPEHLHAH